MNMKKFVVALLKASVVLLFAVYAILAAPRAAAFQQDLAVIDLDPNASPQDIEKARKDFQDGEAIVRILGEDSVQFGSLMQVSVPGHVYATAPSGSDPSGLDGLPFGPPQPLQGVAGYLGKDRALNLIESYGPDLQAGAGDSGGGTENLINAWIKDEQAKAVNPQLGDPAPPAEAWTTLYKTTVQTCGGGGCQRIGIGVYRLNSLAAHNDYYLVTTTPQSFPAWRGKCDGIFYCDPHTLQRGLWIYGNKQVDHGPTSTNNSGSQTFTIGAGLDASGPGVDASYSATWTQQDVNTIDQSTASQGSWNEKIHFTGAACLPVLGRVPAVSSGTFLSRQAAIFEVPAGTTNVSFPVRANIEFCQYNQKYDYFKPSRYEWADVTADFPLGPPVLAGNPPNVTMAAGSTYPLLVGAYIPNSQEAFAWTASSNTAWLTLQSSGPFAGSQILPLMVDPGIPDGSQAILALNTTPSFAAPAVSSGPLLVKVTVGKPKVQPRAGVLLMGGQDTARRLSEKPQFYDFASKSIFPTSAPVLGTRGGNTATKLHDGTVLITGGHTSLPLIPNGPAPVTASAELFNPATLTFKATGSMLTGRTQHTATLLSDGKVLIAGGLDGSNNAVGTGELYDPATGIFSAAGKMVVPRFWHRAVLSPGSGNTSRVFLVSGERSDSQPVASVEVWKEKDNAFANDVIPMPQGVFYFPEPQLITDGVAAVTGGNAGPPTITNSTQLIDFGSLQVTPGKPLNFRRVAHTLTKLLDGKLLVVGGFNNDTPINYLKAAELGDANGWSLLFDKCPGAPQCPRNTRAFHTASVLPDGTVLLAGGNNEALNASATTEIFDPATKIFTPGPAILPRYFHTATAVATTQSTLLVSPSPSTLGQTIDATVSVESAGLSPTGAVTLLDGATVLGTSELLDGVASFSTSALTVGMHSLTATYAGDSVYDPSVSDAVNHKVNRYTSTVLLSATPNPANLGQDIRLTADIVTDSGEATGSVTFKEGSTVLGTAKVEHDAATAVIHGLTVGSHSISAVYSGDANNDGSASGVVPVVVDQNASVTLLTASPTSVGYGQKVTFTATVQSSSEPVTGTVAFADSGTDLGSAPLAHGQAVFSTSGLGVGAHAVVATYTGDSKHDSSSSKPIGVTVNQAAPSVSLRSSGSPSEIGSPVTFFATVAGPGASPTGTVIFSDGGTQLGGPQPVRDGVANLSTSTLSFGTHSISAAYSGDANYLSAASSALPQNVTKIPASVKLTYAPANPVFGSEVTLTAAVASSAGTPAGSVSFIAGAKTLGSAAVMNGQAVFRTSALSGGTNAVVASYTGDDRHQAENSNPVNIVVGHAAASVGLISAPNPSKYGSPVKFTAAVTGAGGVPTGTVQFTDIDPDGGPIGGPQPVENGVANVTTSTLRTNDRTIEATYSGDPNFSKATSPKLIQHVQPIQAATATKLAYSPEHPVYGGVLTLTAAVTSSSGMPTGSVSFLDGTATLGGAGLDGGTASLQTSSLAAGEHTLTAMYKGTSEFEASTSPAIHVLVAKPLYPAKAVVTANIEPSNVGQTVIFTVTVTAEQGGTPAGSITISEGEIIYGSSPLIDGVGKVSVSNFSAGIHVIRGTYGGDSTHSGATSPPWIQTVN